MNFITGHLWKIATGGATLLAVVLSIMLATSYMENRALVKHRAELSALINDPETGYVAQLSQSRTNVEALKVKLDEQNKAYSDLSADSVARLAAARAALKKGQAETKLMERKLAGFLATKPQGVTLEQRIRDIDHRAMQEFVQ